MSQGAWCPKQSSLMEAFKNITFQQNPTRQSSRTRHQKPGMKNHSRHKKSEFLKYLNYKLTYKRYLGSSFKEEGGFGPFKPTPKKPGFPGLGEKEFSIPGKLISGKGSLLSVYLLPWLGSWQHHTGFCSMTGNWSGQWKRWEPPLWQGGRSHTLGTLRGRHSSIRSPLEDYAFPPKTTLKRRTRLQLTWTRENAQSEEKNYDPHCVSSKNPPGFFLSKQGFPVHIPLSLYKCSLTFPLSPSSAPNIAL